MMGKAMTLKWIKVSIILALMPAISYAIKPMTDDEIKHFMIEESITSFENDNGKNSCPCPESIDKNGKQCSFESAYFKNVSQPKPKCYPDDVTKADVNEYRSKYNIPQAFRKY